MKYRNLVELYDSNRGSNILIYNAGGFGKTTQMKNLNKHLLAHLDQYKTIPLYIDAKSLDKADEKPVLKYVTKMFCGIDITNTDEVEMFFEKRTGVYAYSYLFLIDAINEADDAVKAKIVTDIGRLKESDKIRFIVSSRVNEGYSVFNDFHKFEFCELTDEQIGTYLSGKFSKSGIQVEKFNKSLVDILKIPMYLSVFSYAYKDETFPELYGEKTVRKADLLLAYLYKVAEESRMDKNLATSLEQEVQFTIEHYLPALAFKMCCQGKVSLNNEEYKEIKKELNTEYFLSFFDEEEREELYPMLSQTAKLNYEFPSIARKRLALWCKNGDDYAFSHQNWLHFFAARHIVNLMNAQKIDELEYPMNQEVRRFAGELICEYDKQFKYSKSNHADTTHRCECDFASKIDTDSKMSPIEEFMQKNYVELNERPQGISNLVEIMKIARNYFITAKYNNLNLINCYFYNCNLMNSTFIKSYINLKSLSGSFMVSHMVSSHDGELAALYNSKNICIYDFSTARISNYLTVGYNLFHHLRCGVHRSPFYSLVDELVKERDSDDIQAITLENDYILIGCRDRGEIKIANLQSNKFEESLLNLEDDIFDKENINDFNNGDNGFYQVYRHIGISIDKVDYSPDYKYLYILLNYRYYSDVDDLLRERIGSSFYLLLKLKFEHENEASADKPGDFSSLFILDERWKNNVKLKEFIFNDDNNVILFERKLRKLLPIMGGKCVCMTALGKLFSFDGIGIKYINLNKDERCCDIAASNLYIYALIVNSSSAVSLIILDNNLNLKNDIVILEHIKLMGMLKLPQLIYSKNGYLTIIINDTVTILNVTNPINIKMLKRYRIGAFNMRYGAYRTSISVSPKFPNAIVKTSNGLFVWNIWDDKIIDEIKPLSCYLSGCDFSHLRGIDKGKYKDSDAQIYKTLYQNGAIVPEEFIPKPIPFETDDD